MPAARTSTRKATPRKARRSRHGRHRITRLAFLCAAVLLAAGFHDATGYGLAGLLIIADILV